MAVSPLHLGPLGQRLFEAVIVDNDMTLVDSNQGIRRAWLEWAGAMGLDPWLLADKTGMSTAGIVASVVADELARPAAIAKIDDLELRYADTTKSLPGSARLLDSLPDERIAVASSGTHAIIKARMDAAGLRRPAIIVGCEDVEHAKPAPDIFLVAAERLGFSTSNCLVIEDSLNGLEAARAAGCATLAVTTSHEPAELSADAIVDTLADVFWRVDEDGIYVELA